MAGLVPSSGVCVRGYWAAAASMVLRLILLSIECPTLICISLGSEVNRETVVIGFAGVRIKFEPLAIVNWGQLKRQPGIQTALR